MKHDIAPWMRRDGPTPSWNSCTFHPPARGAIYTIRVDETEMSAKLSYMGEWFDSSLTNGGKKLNLSGEIFWFGVL